MRPWYPQHFLSIPIEQGTVLNLVAFVSDRSKNEEERVWDGPWVKPVTQEQMLEDFADWDERPRNLLKVRIADVTSSRGDAERPRQLVKEPQRWSLHESLPLDFWTQGRITLLGDAASPLRLCSP
jgi:salicylate hydroxylase